MTDRRQANFTSAPFVPAMAAASPEQVHALLAATYLGDPEARKAAEQQLKQVCPGHSRRGRSLMPGFISLRMSPAFPRFFFISLRNLPLTKL